MDDWRTDKRGLHSVRRCDGFDLWQVSAQLAGYRIFNVTALLPISFLGFVGNTLMIIVVRKGTELKKTTNYFIVNVRTVSPDFVVLISGLAETVLHSGNGPLRRGIVARNTNQNWENQTSYRDESVWSVTIPFFLFTFFANPIFTNLFIQTTSPIFRFTLSSATNPIICFTFMAGMGDIH